MYDMYDMYDIRHRIGAAAPASAVYDLFATREGLARWWTDDTTGDSVVGGKVTFRFGAPDRYFTMEVIELTPNERVRWRCVEGPDEWVGTEFIFEIRAGDDETLVLFTHAGWREPVEFMYHCSSKWGSYLLSAKQYLETGRGRPFPDDVKMSSFD